MTPGDLTVGVVPSFGPSVDSDRPTGSPPARGIDRVDETLGGSDSEEFELAGTGDEATTSATTFETVSEYEVSRGQRGLLVEMAVSAESNGEVRLAANGRLWGPYTGAIDIEIPGDEALLYGSRVVVEHRSTDGNSTTTQASIVAKEV
jgi:hypothetical protein